MAQDNKYTKLIKNIGLLTLGSFATKFLSFFLVPLYTSILTTEEYGIYDIVHTTIVLLVPILSVNIQEAVVRFALTKNSDKSVILWCGLKYVGCAMFSVALLLYVNNMLKVFRVFYEHASAFFALFSLTALNQVLASFTRGIDRVRDYSIASVLSSLVTIVLNIYLLAFAGMGLRGYFLAYIMGVGMSCVYLAFRIPLTKYRLAISDRVRQRKQEQQMLQYSSPLVLNSVAWWINNASDRYIVTWICGMAVNGLYSVAYKIPSTFSMFTNIFNQAWLISCSKEYDPEDSEGFFTKSYSSYGMVMTVMCSVIIVFSRFEANVLFSKAFYDAWIYIPFLSISVVFGALSGVIDGVFLAVNDSRICSVSAILGAAVNVVLNIVLIMYIGAIGAAIATAISYCVIWMIRLIHVKEYIVLKIHIIRDVCSYVVLIMQSVFLFLCKESLFYYAISLFLTGAIILLYKEELKVLVKKVAIGVFHKNPQGY